MADRMTLDEAIALLNTCTRETLSDEAFGDMEVYWMRGEEEIASGYFGRDARDVTVGDTTFAGDEADRLRECGKRGRAERNDAGGGQ